jgi:hypothetical protein
MNIEDTEFIELISKSSSRFELWNKFLGEERPEKVAEVGVWKGDFAKHILESNKFIKKYYMIDPWTKLADWNKPFNVEMKVFDEIYHEAINKTEFAAKKIKVLRGTTKEVVNKIPDDSLDFIYIDGDHTLRGITIDLIKLFPKVKNNGYIGGDDFLPTPWQHNLNYEPTFVCPFSIYFAEAVDLPIVALPYNQFLLQKKDHTYFDFYDTTDKYNDISLNKFSYRFIKKVTKQKLNFLRPLIGK